MQKVQAITAVAILALAINAHAEEYSKVSDYEGLIKIEYVTKATINELEAKKAKLEAAKALPNHRLFELNEQIAIIESDIAGLKEQGVVEYVEPEEVEEEAPGIDELAGKEGVNWG